PKEVDQRDAARKRTVVSNLVGKMDKVLVLTTEQRGKLSTILQNNWNESWSQTQWLTMGNQYFPPTPDAKIFPILTETQKNVWRGIGKGTVRFGLNVNILQGFEMEEEVWDDDPPRQKQVEKDNRSPDSV